MLDILRNAEVSVKFEIMAKLTHSALITQFASWQLFLNATSTIVLWNVTNLHLRKLVIQGYKLVVMTIVVNSNNNLCTAWVLFNWKIAVQFQVLGKGTLV